MSSVGIQFIFRASVSAFTKGVASASNSINGLKQSLKSLGAGDLIRGAGFGALVGGIARGMSSAADEAKRLSAELSEQGKIIPENVAALARYGDTMAKLKSISFDVFGSIAGYMEKVGLGVGELIYGTEALADAQKKMAEEAAAAAKAMAQAELEKAQSERQGFERDQAFAGGTNTDKANILLKEQVELLKKRDETVAGTAARERAELAIAKNRTELRKIDVAEAKDLAAAEEQQKRAAEAKAAEEKRVERERLNKVALTVEELAAQETGGFVAGDDPRLRARQTLQLEERARMLGQRGDIKGALDLQSKADQMRAGLENATATSQVLTPQAAQSAFSEALKPTNDELTALREAVSGIIKAQK